MREARTLYIEQQPSDSSDASFSLDQDIAPFAIPKFRSGELHSIVGHLNRSVSADFKALK